MPTNNRSAKKTISTLDVYRNEAFDIGFYNYFKEKNDNKISQVLNSKDRNVKLSTVTYRQLNSWEEQGLLIGEREGREWRRFSIMDALWLKIILELREFGLGLDKIKIAKESLSYMSKECKVAMPFLEFYTAFAIGSKMPVLLLVFKDGITVPANFTQYKVASEYIGVENHLQINLNKLLQNLFPSVDLKPKYISEIPVDVDEMELLAFLRLGEYEKVEIQYKNGKMQVVEGMQRINANSIIGEVIKEKSYQKIEIIIDNGKKVSLRRTVKKQINKKG